ncbi:DNA cytosine methyltransferase [Megalodesulfovibrio gigas]|uniref:DNA (cytosine-5-)-methyltransferase n=1 Tax=Megalodesulfovibrio gigas (strain ATCC 19364 / DSM 1382 / NCIMB 9332 / VKM B-1759) TaxID=1121448 RepID=T2GC96_MEGG1|nr:DNA cytosine methyltransferase [Megalodesulfovibrio gigas]AGW13799.1 putative DNA-cytosine methyltransferase [Megalodesulfovibrio gigas DSM 1382 = ATCC 19364]
MPFDVQKKIDRLNNGGAPRVLDLFAGCGGISLGFHAAGYALCAAIEMDPVAAASHALNFFPHHDEAGRNRHARSRDIVLTEPYPFLQELGFAEPEAAIDVIVGGPPCQAFARVGRAKLREVAEHPHAFIRDPRSDLYLRYLEYIRQLKPVALLVENVPDILNHGGHNIYEEMGEVLEDLGYTCRYTLLNAVHYGVPEMRERAFLIGYAAGVSAEVVFPAPTHRHVLPKGYEGSRQVALKYQPEAGCCGPDGQHSRLVATPQGGPELPPAITAWEALQDLPPIRDHLEGRLKKGPRRFDRLCPYDETRPVTEYGRRMRTWPGFENSLGVYDHVIRYLPRDYAIFARMQAGDQYPQAYRHALALFDEKLAALQAKGQAPAEGSHEYTSLRDATVPPYDPGKFPNKWRKMEADQPARTLMAHLGKDSYSHIHYDSSQARTISVREAARLQSFPDGFRFVGPMNPGFRQIGNAVPPLMARALADVMLSTLRGHGGR